MIYKKFISLFMSFVFLIQPVYLSAFTAINAEQRPENVGNFILTSDRPSDLPVAGYSEYFEQESINIFKDIDLSEYTGQKIFAGYGIYDVNENNCHYVEVPGKTKKDFDKKFKDISEYNKHSYGKSRVRMTYPECITLANEFGGTPVVIDSSSENYFVKRVFGSESGFWIGTTISDCIDTYKSAINRTQFFTKFKSPTPCSTETKNIKMNKYGYWDKVNSEQVFDCVVEWSSRNYDRPIKVCAPWWKVYREYKNSAIGLISKRELDRINQADIPAKLNICTQYNEDAVINQSTAVARDVTCTSYYSATVAPECLFDSHQEQCKVDECGGYIRNACRMKFEEVTGKGYIKGQVVYKGQKLSVKVKDEVKTHVFTCPPSPPSAKECTRSNNVLIFPEECPNSQCDALKACLYGAITENDITECQTKYTCTKIYASRDIPPLLSPEGNVIEMYGLCPSGEQLTFYPNILDKNDKTCLEYEQIEVKKNITEKCITNRNFTDHEVNVALDEKDIYQDDPNCLRIDTVEDSQLNTPITVAMELKGYFKHKISKVFIDQNTEVLYHGGSDENTLHAMTGGRITTSFDTSDKSQTKECTINLECSDYNSATFRDRNQKVLFDSGSKNSDINGIYINSGEVYVTVYTTATDSECANYASDHGFSDYEEGSTFKKERNNDTECKIKLKSIQQDSKYSFISTLGNELKINMYGTVTKQTCLESAICIGGAYNENGFGVDYSSTGSCTITTGNTPTDYMEELANTNNCDIDSNKFAVNKECVPLAQKASIYTEINGFESILAFEDYVGGGFGYYSNFITIPPKSNIDLVTTDEIISKQTFPLVDISNVTDYETYVSSILHISYKSKVASDTALLFIGVGALLYKNYLSATFISVNGGLVAYVIVALITPSRNMDAQTLDWAIYKTVPTDYFGKFENRKKLLSDKTLEYGATIKANGKNWIYIEGYNKIPKRDQWDFVLELLQVSKLKKQLLYCSGYNETNVKKMTHPAEDSLITGHPSCKWYNIFCEKANYFIWSTNVGVSKIVNTIFSGADETVTFLLPYKGNFKITAYDKYGSIVGDTNLTSESFVNTNSANKIKYAQVKLGYKMQLAPGINKDSACINDYMVEIGGGVSGAYHELSTTGSHVNCTKSNDQYVLDHAITDIEILSDNMTNKSFKFKLTRPLPFINRIFLGTLDKEQIRKYRCYDDFEDCGETDYKEIK